MDEVFIREDLVEAAVGRLRQRGVMIGSPEVHQAWLRHGVRRYIDHLLALLEQDLAEELAQEDQEDGEDDALS